MSKTRHTAQQCKQRAVLLFDAIPEFVIVRCCGRGSAATRSGSRPRAELIGRRADLR
jgi:hypothetical protein